MANPVFIKYYIAHIFLFQMAWPIFSQIFSFFSLTVGQK